MKRAFQLFATYHVTPTYSLFIYLAIKESQNENHVIEEYVLIMSVNERMETRATNDFSVDSYFLSLRKEEKKKRKHRFHFHIPNNWLIRDNHSMFALLLHNVNRIA